MDRYDTKSKIIIENDLKTSNCQGNKIKKCNKNGFLYELKKNKILFIMLLPVIIYFFVFSYIPMAGIVVAFKRYRFDAGLFLSPWNGLRNFDFFFRSGTAATITRNTVLYNLAFIITGVILQIATAIFIAEIGTKFVKKYLQSMMFIPFFISWVVVGTFVYNFFNYDYGTLNHFLLMFGQKRIDVYGTTSAWPFIIVFFNNWKSLGFSSLIYLSALLSIDKNLYEAASIDGANIVQRIKQISLPLLLPTIAIMVLLAIGQLFRGNFDLFYNVIGNDGLLFSKTDVIDTFVFRSLVNSADIGMTAAAGVYQAVLCFLIIMVSNFIIKKYNPDYSLF
jgi:putative aldouronate transport system permease protein